MNEQRLPPAVTGAEMRLDALIAELRALRDLLTPPSPPPATEPETVELRGVATVAAAEPMPEPMPTPEPDAPPKPTRRSRRRKA